MKSYISATLYVRTKQTLFKVPCSRLFFPGSHKGESVCNILSLPCSRHTTSRELVKLIIASQTHKSHRRVIFHVAECFLAMGRRSTKPSDVARWLQAFIWINRKVYLLSLDVVAARVITAGTPITQTPTPLHTFPGDSSTLS